MERKFQILHVCTGNIGRSPMAERMLADRLSRLSEGGVERFANSSAGTSGCEGFPMEPFSRRVLEERAIDPSGFVARRLTASLLVEADLVLVATREHRALVVGAVPAAVRRTFTLREFGRMATPVVEAEPSELGTGPTAVAARVDLASRLRGVVDRTRPEEEDIADPMGEPLDFYRARAAEIDTACDQAASLLLGVR